MRRGLVIIIFMVTLFFFSVSAFSKLEIIHSPLKPKAGETVKFYVNLDTEAEGVNLWIEECKGNQCFLPEILEMEEVEPGKYTADYKLRNDTTLVHYKVNVTYQNGSYLETELYEFEVEPQSQTNAVSEEKKTPGFEIQGILVSVIVLILISRRLSR